MNAFINRISVLTLLVLLNYLSGHAQDKQVDSALFYKTVQTYVNPVLPGDHPDPTLLKVGNDFYHCGSTFHFNPYMPIYHSTDLVHWEVIARVLSQENADWVSDKPSAGIWQGMMRISDGYLMLITSSLATYYLPKLASLHTNKELRAEIIHGYKIILPAVFFSCTVIYFLRFFIIKVLYTSDFSSMSDLFFYQLFRHT